MVHLDSNPVVAQQRGEVGCLERVHRVHELGAVERVGGREHAAREQAQLHQPRHRLVLGRLGRARGEPAAALARQARQHARHVLRLAPPLLLAAERNVGDNCFATPTQNSSCSDTHSQSRLLGVAN